MTLGNSYIFKAFQGNYFKLTSPHQQNLQASFWKILSLYMNCKKDAKKILQRRDNIAVI